MLILRPFLHFLYNYFKSQHDLISAVKALQQIAEQLGKKDWNLSLNYCDENQNWQTPIRNGAYNSTVNCTCSLGDCNINAMYVSFFVLLFNQYIYPYLSKYTEPKSEC